MNARVPLSVLILAAPLLGQQRGITAEQVMKLRQVGNAVAGNGWVAFTRTAPRPASHDPGAAYTHLYLIPDLRAALAGQVVERLLVGGRESVRGVSVRPGGGELTIVYRGEGDAHAEIYSIPLDGGEPQRITQTPRGIDSYKWRPDGKAVAYTSLDPLPARRSEAIRQGFRQRVVDEDYRQIGLWLWEEETGESKKLTEGRSVFGYEWAPDGTKLALALAPRNLVDDSYMFKRLFLLDLEKNSTSPLVDNPGKLGQFAWSPDSRQVAYLSAHDRRDPHAGMLYVVDAETREVRSLTDGLLGMVHHVEWLYAGPQPIILAAISRGVETDLVIIDPQTAEMGGELLAGSPAFRSFIHHGDGALLLVGSTATHPNELFAITDLRPGASIQRLTDSNPWLEDVAFGRQEVVRFDARDGLSIEGMLIYPVGYQGGTRYPLVVVVHGGPESHHSDGWLTSYSNWGQILAAKGYFSWYPNYRSSTGYGVAFARKNHGDPMGGEFRDHLDAIEHFDDRGLIDRQRVGIGGGSYGGYTSAWAAVQHTEHFAAAVSFVPFVDIRTKWYTTDIPWEFYYVHYEEQWPWEEPGMLIDRSPLTWAENCRTPLLLLGGTADPRVHPSQPHMLYRKIRMSTSTPVRYIQYPGEGHGNRTNVYRYDYLLRAMRWFDHYLQPGDRRQASPPEPDLDYSLWTGGG